MNPEKQVFVWFFWVFYGGRAAASLTFGRRGRVLGLFNVQGSEDG